jgi:hypothetical protein
MALSKHKERLDWVVSILTGYQAHGIKVVSVREMLAMLEDGQVLAAEKPDPDEGVPAALDPRADPMTGCMPVTAEGNVSR